MNFRDELSLKGLISSASTASLMQREMIALFFAATPNLSLNEEFVSLPPSINFKLACK